MAQTSPSPLRALLNARRRVLGRQLLGATGQALALRLAAAVAALAGIAGLGALSADALQQAAQATPDPQAVVTPGGPYVDTAFWLAALLIVVQSFRLMEGLYRHHGARVLSTLPLPLEAQFIERLLTAGVEAVLMWLAALAFMVPIWALTGDPRALYGAGLIGAGLWISLSLGFAVQLYAGISSFGGGDGLGQLGRVDTGGGTAAAFTISPGLSMAAALTLTLLIKLAVVDEALVRGTSRLFWLGLGVPSAISAVALFKARQWFMAHYPMLLARFYESDLIQFDSGYNYHNSVVSGRKGLYERMVPAKVLGLYRKDALQLGRRYPMLRLLAVALWIVVGIVASGSGQGPWLPAAIALAYTLAMAAPWSRLYSQDLEPHVMETLPIPEGLARQAKLLASAREVLVLAIPSAVLIVALGPWPTAPISAGVLVLALAILTPSMLLMAQRVGAGPSRLLGFLLASAAVSAATLFGL